MGKIANVHRVPRSAWRRWSDAGRMAFKRVYGGNLFALGAVPAWNAAFVAACEVSGLDVEYGGRS